MSGDKESTMETGVVFERVLTAGEVRRARAEDLEKEEEHTRYARKTDRKVLFFLESISTSVDELVELSRAQSKKAPSAPFWSREPEGLASDPEEEEEEEEGPIHTKERVVRRDEKRWEGEAVSGAQFRELQEELRVEKETGECLHKQMSACQQTYLDLNSRIVERDRQIAELTMQVKKLTEKE